MYTFIATSLWNLEDCDSPARPRLAGVERSDEPEPEEEVSSDDSDWLMDLWRTRSSAASASVRVNIQQLCIYQVMDKISQNFRRSCFDVFLGFKEFGRVHESMFWAFLNCWIWNLLFAVAISWEAGNPDWNWFVALHIVKILETCNPHPWPPGKRLHNWHNYGKSWFSMGKSAIRMAILSRKSVVNCYRGHCLRVNFIAIIHSTSSQTGSHSESQELVLIRLNCLARVEDRRYRPLQECRPLRCTGKKRASDPLVNVCSRLRSYGKSPLFNKYK